MGVTFGLHRTLDQLGAIIGPIFAFASMLLLGLAMRDIFWLSFIPGSIALVILLIFVKEQVGKPGQGIRLVRDIKTVLGGQFTLLLLVVGLFSVGAFNFSFVLLRAKEAGVAQVFIPMVYAAINLAHTTIAIPAGLLSDKIGKEKVLVIGTELSSFQPSFFLFPSQIMPTRSLSLSFTELISELWKPFRGR